VDLAHAESVVQRRAVEPDVMYHPRRKVSIRPEDALMTIDPRVARTRLHVLAHARRLLAEGGPSNVSFTNLAREAQVGRQTLYTHWQTPEKLIAEAILGGYDASLPHEAESLDDAIRSWIVSVSETLAQPAHGVALTTLAALAYHDQASLDALKQIGLERYQTFCELVEPFGVQCPQADFMLLSGPLFANLFFRREPISDDFVSMLTTLIADRLTTRSPLSSTRSVA
jgi:AcrR family transcriptional regulator